MRNMRSLFLVMATVWAMLKKGNMKKTDLLLFFLERGQNASIFPK